MQDCIRQFLNCYIRCHGTHTCHGKKVNDNAWQATVIISLLPATGIQEYATAIRTLQLCRSRQ
eukprot:5338093-Karenia_brevis.AAC.1